MEKHDEYQLDFLDWFQIWETNEDRLHEVATIKNDSSGELVAITIH